MPLFTVNKKLLPLKIHFFVGMAGAASIMPFLSTVAKQRGYSSVIVGIILTMIPIPGLLLKPLVGVIVDKYKCHKSVIALVQIVKSVVVCVLIFIPGKTAENGLKDADVIKSPLFWLFSGCLILLKTGSFVRTVVDDTISVGLLGKDKHKYGQQRMWGSVGWGTMSFVSGLCVDWYSKGQPHKDYTLGFVVSLIFLILDTYVVSTIQVVDVKKTDTQTKTSGIKKLFTEMRVLTFLLWVIAFGFFNSFILYFVFLYMEDLSKIFHPEMKPWMKSLQGLSITIQCAGGEVPFFFLSSYILKRVKHMNVFSLVFFTFSLRFFLYSVIENPVWVLPVELLNGVTFALAYSTAVSYAAHLAPVGAEGTLQGVVGTALDGMGLPIGCFVGGHLFEHLGSITSFKLLSGIALLTCVVQTVVNHLINRWARNEEVKDRYSKVEVKDNVEEATTVM